MEAVGNFMPVQSLIADGYQKVDPWDQSVPSPSELYAGKIGSQGWLEEKPQYASHLFESESDSDTNVGEQDFTGGTPVLSARGGPEEASADDAVMEMQGDVIAGGDAGIADVADAVADKDGDVVAHLSSRRYSIPVRVSKGSLFHVARQTWKMDRPQQSHEEEAKCTPDTSYV